MTLKIPLSKPNNEVFDSCLNTTTHNSIFFKVHRDTLVLKILYLKVDSTMIWD